jgi:hypothetical protein
LCSHSAGTILDADAVEQPKMDYEVYYEEQAREAEELRRKEQLRVAELKFPVARYTNLLNISSYMLVQWDGRYLGSTFLTLIRL